MRSLPSITKRWNAIFLLFLIALFAPGFAHAEESERAAKKTDEEAYSDLLKRAKLAADNNKIAEAIGLWMQAWNLRPHWHLPCYIGTGHFLLKEPDKAATYLTRCLKLAPFPTTEKGAEHRRREREMLEVCLDHVATLTISAPEGARVLVDGEEKGRAPLFEEVFVMPGEHRFRAELDGRIVERSLKVARREKHALELVFPVPTPIAIQKDLDLKPVVRVGAPAFAMQARPASSDALVSRTVFRSMFVVGGVLSMSALSGGAVLGSLATVEERREGGHFKAAWTAKCDGNILLSNEHKDLAIQAGDRRVIYSNAGTALFIAAGVLGTVSIVGALSERFLIAPTLTGAKGSYVL